DLLPSAPTRGASDLMAARAVAVEGGDRDVVARSRNDREHRIGGNTEGPGDRRTVAAQARHHALVGAGGRVEGVAAGGGMALGAGRGGRNMIRRLSRLVQVGGEGRCRGVAAIAVA